MATSLTQFGITWTFDADYTTGQYANGDYYVVAPSGLTVTGISPASTVSGGRTINGSMVNPVVADGGDQGFDSGAAVPPYDAALNVARPGGNDLSAGNPLVLAAGSSLISSISVPTAGGPPPQLSDAAVLTVVASAPAAGAFRPPYYGTDKSGTWNKSDLDYSILRSLASVTGTPSLATVEAYVTRPWIEVNLSYMGRFLHPSNNQEDYGADLAEQMGDCLMSLHLNYTNEQKETLFLRVVQYGIDVYGVVRSGGTFGADGGHNLGRKAALLLSARALGDSTMLAYADADTHFIFQEDLQTWYITEADVGRAVTAPRETYTSDYVGLAEWGEKHDTAPNRDDSRFLALYRDTNSRGCLSAALSAGLLANGKSQWNWPPFFDHWFRYYNLYVANSYSGFNPIPTFHENMWVAYSPLVYAPTPPTSLAATTSGPTSIGLTWTDESADETGFSIERSLNGSTGWTEIGTVGAGVEAWTDTGLSPSTAYHYRVAATNAYGSSAYSASDSATTDAAPVVLAGRPGGGIFAMGF